MEEITTSQMETSNLTRVRVAAYWLVLIFGIVLGSAFVAFTTYNIWLDPAMRKVVELHFAAVIGLPAITLASLGVVLILESTSGPIEFDGFGFKFHGAAGPLIFWVVCFLSMTAALKLVW
jgi:hypothetical protein